jgi:miniconductance mechanosensitive channel
MMSDAILQRTASLLSNFEIGTLWAGVLSRILIGIVIVLIAWFAWFLAVRVVSRILERVAKRTKNTWDDEFLARGLYRRAARLVPALIIWFAAPAFLTGMPQVLHFIRILAALSMIITLVQSVVNFLSFANSIYDRRNESKRRPIKGIIQALQVAAIISGLLLAFSVVTEKPVSGLMAGIGALSAVLMLVFRDPLMGLVSGFQISSNDMVRIGDWIEVPSQGADGDVIDISLLNVTVRNFDKTYVTFPIQSLTTSGFKNWRGMSEAGGRRIKRWLSIDATSVRFIQEKDLQRLKSIDILAPYLTAKITDIQEANKAMGADRNRHPLNGRALTNLGIFRAYAKAYVSHHTKVKSDMTLLVRQLQSSPEGIPMEIYVFSADTVWSDYENLQSDIFDHLFAALEEFDLRPFQNPTGADFRTLAGPV